MKISIVAMAMAMVLGGSLGFVSSAGDLPDPNLTPGAIDPACTADILRTTSTKARRGTTAATKTEAYRKYGVTPHQGICSGPRGCEVDHRVPLEACGLDAQEDLWIMPYDGPCNASDKDHLENQTKADILAGLAVEEGQARFLAPDWRVEYQKRFGKSCAAE